MSHRGIMNCKWEVVHWPNNLRLKLCDTKEHAEKIAMISGKGYVVREVWFFTDGTEYGGNQHRKK